MSCFRMAALWMCNNLKSIVKHVWQNYVKRILSFTLFTKFQQWGIYRKQFITYYKLDNLKEFMKHYPPQWFNMPSHAPSIQSCY